MERCKHGVMSQACAMCARLADHHKEVRRPLNTEQSTPFSMAAIDPNEVERIGFVCVKSERNHATHARLDANTQTVHILGNPFRWLIEEILVKAPNVKVIQVLPTHFFRLKSHKDLCAARGVQLVAGHARPDLAWEPGEMRHDKSFFAQQTFLEKLEGEQKRLFDELITFGFESAEIVLKYYGLQGHETQTQVNLMKEYGHCANHVVSMYVHAVLSYLDPAFATGQRSKQIADTMRRRVARLREHFAKATSTKAVLDAVAQRHGLSRMPTKLPLARLEVFEAVVEAKKDGRLDQLHVKDPRRYDVLMLRFGLHEDHPAICRTLEEVAEIMSGFASRQRARQLEEEALEELGIDENMLRPERLLNGRVRKKTPKKTALTEPANPENLKLLFLQVAAAVSQHYSLEPGEILNETREVRIAFPRQVLMYLLHEDCKWSFPKIGQALDKDHTTVLHGHQKVREQQKTDAELWVDLKKIRELVQQLKSS